MNLFFTHGEGIFRARILGGHVNAEHQIPRCSRQGRTNSLLPIRILDQSHAVMKLVQR